MTDTSKSVSGASWWLTVVGCVVLMIALVGVLL